MEADRYYSRAAFMLPYSGNPQNQVLFLYNRLTVSHSMHGHALGEDICTSSYHLSNVVRTIFKKEELCFLV